MCTLLLVGRLVVVRTVVCSCAVFAGMVRTRTQVVDRQKRVAAKVLKGTLEEEKAHVVKAWKEPSTALKLEIGQLLAEKQQSLKQLQARLKRQGYQHGSGTIYRWRDKHIKGHRPRHSGGQDQLTSPRRESLQKETAAAVLNRSAKSKKKFRTLLVKAIAGSREDRGESALGLTTVRKNATPRYINNVFNIVKPQYTTLPRWLACRDIRNAITLYCIMKAVMFDRNFSMWILCFNCHNADFSTICFGYVSHSENKRVVVPKDLHRTREIEVVATKSSTLPHSIKYASLQAGNGGTGDILLLYKVNLDCSKTAASLIRPPPSLHPPPPPPPPPRAHNRAYCL